MVKCERITYIINIAIDKMPYTKYDVCKRDRIIHELVKEVVFFQGEELKIHVKFLGECH